MKEAEYASETSCVWNTHVSVDSSQSSSIIKYHCQNPLENPKQDYINYTS